MAADDAGRGTLSAPAREADGGDEGDFVTSLFDRPQPSQVDETADWEALTDTAYADTAHAGSQSTQARAGTSTGRRREGASHHARSKSSRSRRSWIIPALALLVIVAVAVAGVAIARTALRSLHDTPDYTGAGTGQVTVRVKAGDGSSDIAKTLHDSDVVASTKAFVDAAHKSGRSGDFQAGWFSLRHHMSGTAAVATLLDPRARLSKKVTIPEGTIEPAVLAAVAKATGLPVAELTRAFENLAGIGVPAAFGAKSAEGFLFPSTYQFDPDLTASDALQDLTTQFQAEARKLNLIASAASLRVTPYQLLTIASMVEAEARFAADRPRVARVILNRLAKHMNLGFDSTTAYGLKIQGKDPRTATYKERSPYNTRLNPGLPPTPIGNPGEAALKAAQHPTAGNWLYFVSKDAAGHLLFTNDVKVFDAASEQCRIHKWGCT